MQITVNDFEETITNEKYGIQQIESKKSDFAAQGRKLIKEMTNNFIGIVNNDELAQSRLILKTKADAITIFLESGIINLPFDNVNQIDNFFDEPKKETEVNVNLIVKAQAVNPSGLRIDQICTVSELLAATDKQSDIILKRVTELLNDIDKNHKTKNKN